MELNPDQIAELLKEAKARGLVEVSPCLWPEGMRKPTTDCFWKWVKHVRTWNEADKATQNFPDLDFLREYDVWWLRGYRNGVDQIDEKCRRMIISWRSRALELFVSGLARQDGAIVGLDLEAAAKHCWRYQHMYEDLRKNQPDWNLPECSVIRHRGERALYSFSLENGSKIGIINQEEGSFPGDGYSWVCCEEISRYRAPDEVWAQAKIVCQGAAGSKGGFVHAITNTNGGNLGWQELKRGAKNATILPLNHNGVPHSEGIEVRELPSGTTFMKIHHFADPGKDEKWLEKLRKELPLRQFLQEILMIEDVYDGEPVWADFHYDLHCPKEYRKSIPAPQPTAQYVAGWDVGSSLNPAFVLLECLDKKVRAVVEVTTMIPMPMSQFCEKVKNTLKTFFSGLPPHIEHVCDPAAFARSSVNMQSAVDVAEKYGFRLKAASTNNLTVRIDTVSEMLIDTISEDGDVIIPVFTISEFGCPMLSNALKGAYVYPKRRDGMHMKPKKDIWSNPADALQYATLGLPSVMQKSKNKIRSYANL